MKKLVLVTALCSIVMTSCNPEPTADFETNKNTYTAGETIECTNKSVDAKSYLWTLPDGQTETAENLDVYIDGTTDDQEYLITLKAYNKNEKESDEVSRSVTIKAATGNAVFWQRAGSGYGITVVQVAGLSSNITSDYTIEPECGAQGCAVFNGLKVGTYSYFASDDNYEWSGTFDITADGCFVLELA